jgi:transposase-like protein
MEKFAKTGDFCPNEACPDYGKLQNAHKQNIKKNGRTPKGVQRYQCKTCHRTFTATTGTILYRKRTPEHEILETLALLAEGSRISSLSRTKGHKEDTILAWLREAAQHAGQVEQALMADFRVKRGQLDALWSYVGNKGKKRLSGNGSKRPVLAFNLSGYG